MAGKTFGPAKTFNKFVPQAPVIVVIVLEKPKLVTQIGGVIKNKEYPLIDIGIAAEHFCLQAAEEGLGTCMLGWFNEKSIKKLLHIPAKKSIGLLITLGYPADNYPVRSKIRKERYVFRKIRNKPFNKSQNSNLCRKFCNLWIWCRGGYGCAWS